MNILVMRFSAMGDVVLLTPVLMAIAADHPNLHITLVTRGNYIPFFHNIPNLNAIGYNLKKYRGLTGIWEFYKEINKFGPYDKIIDLHSSLRSRILSLFYKFSGIPSFRINKGRREKIKQTRRKNKVLVKLPHAVERYLRVFEKADIPGKIRKGPWINVDLPSKLKARKYYEELKIPKKKEQLRIGFAPFAGHALKIWPFQKSITLLKLLHKEYPKAHIFLFGSPGELEKLERLQKEVDLCHIVKGEKLDGMRGELGVIEKLDILIGMDSSNLHIAALLGIPVIGIFGTTHPYSGFGPYQQEELGVLQIEHLQCRPCSIYGNTTCYRKDFACMELVDPMDVIKRMHKILDS